MRAILRPVLLFFTIAVLLAGNVARSQDDVRFSRSLAESEAEAIGLSRLSSDQLAVLDALVRRDVAQSRFVMKEPRAARFSARLSEDERRNAGLTQLSEAGISELDAAVERLMAPPATAAAGMSTSSGQPIQSFKIRRDPEIHGSVTLMVAAGSHGYRAYGGGLEVYYDDPANRYSIGVGVSEIRSKGGLYGGFYGDDYRYGRPGPFGRRW